MTDVVINSRIADELGYQDLENNTVRCEDCRTNLLILMKVKESDEKQEVQCHCFCGGTSFKLKLQGKFYFAPVTGVAIKKIDGGAFYLEKT
jgi:hypothetical protein